jgi:diguanylate cyclase (GGDEF)-like protein
MGKTLRAERVYIFEERPGGVYSNTFEWCSAGMISQKDNLQSIPQGAMERWMNRFREHENIILKSVDSVRESDPRMYAYLQPQEIHSVVASPLLYENRIIGFYGVDNPPRHVMNNISELFTIIGYFIVLLLRRYEMVRRLERLSFHDELTDAGNRHAMDVYLEQIDDAKSLGAVYIDVTGLKMVNDTQGHRAGDALIVSACDCLREVFDGEHEALFRLGGDEFLVLCEGFTQTAFLGKIAQLRVLSAERSLVLAIGSAWSEEIGGNADWLIAQADSKMYEDKRNYYASEHDRRRN